MSLRVDIDIADALVSEKAFSVIDSVLRARDPGDFILAGLWALPGGKAVTLLPDQVRSDWGTNPVYPKWGSSDWLLDASRWEQIARRGAGDFFLASKGLASAVDGTGAGLPLVSAAALPENAGLFVEVFGYGVPGTAVPDLLQVAFGGGLVLHVHSSGVADLEDRRPATLAASSGQGVTLTKGQPLTGGTLAGGTRGGAAELTGRMLGIVLLPYRRGRLLVATSQGGLFEVLIGGRDDGSDAFASRRAPGESAYHITTDAGQVTLTPSPAVRALVAANPLSCAQALLNTPAGLLTSPVVPLPYDVATGPSSIFGEADAQDGTGLSLSVVGPDGSAFAPSEADRASALIYQVAFTSPSPGAFPILYSLEMKWDRTLGTKTYGTTTVPTAHTVTGNVVSGRLSLSRDRGQKSAEVIIDNPGDHYTSLKDLWNRLALISVTPSAGDAAFFPAGASAGTALPLFLGLTDPVEFTDGVGSRLRVPLSGLRKRLRSHLLNDSQKFDGMLDTDVVRQILHDAGVDDSAIVIYDDGGTPLTRADPGDDPLWQPANGQSADEFIQHLADTWSGWVWDDIAGVYYYAPRDYFASAILAENGGRVPQVYQSTPTPFSQAATRPVNTGCLVALKDSVKQTAEEPRANEFWVLGQDEDGNIVTSHYEDWGSIHDRTAANYVGERRTLLYASGSLTTPGACAVVLGALYIAFGQAVRSVAFALPDLQLTQIPLDGPVQLEGYGVGLITGLDADLTCDRSRRTEYTYEVLT